MCLEVIDTRRPVIDTGVAPGLGTVAVPHYADGGGWTTQILLVNPSNAAMTGTIEFRSDDGAVVDVPLIGQTTKAYSVPPRSSQKLVTAGVAATSGAVRIIPVGGGATPTPLVVFSYKPGGAITVSEAGVPATSGTAFRMYVESSGVAGTAGNIQAGIAVANNGPSTVPLTFELFNMDGSTTGLPRPVTLSLPGFGHTGKFLSDIFQNQALSSSFKGVLRISTTSAPGISVVGLRTHYNERLDFLITTTPPSNETATASSTERYFPQLAEGGGYTTQFILFSGSVGQSSSGTLRFFDGLGQQLSLMLP